MESLTKIKVVRHNNKVLVFNDKMQDLLSESSEHGSNQIISHHYDGLQFIAMPDGKVYIELVALQKRTRLLK